MAKAKEELNTLKEEVKTASRKLHELTSVKISATVTSKQQRRNMIIES